MATIRLLRPADSVLNSAPAPQWLLLNGILGEKIFLRGRRERKVSTCYWYHSRDRRLQFHQPCFIILDHRVVLKTSVCSAPTEMCYMRRHQDAGNNIYRLLLTQYVITAVYVSDVQWVTTVTQISSHQHLRSPHAKLPQQLCRSYRRHIAFSNQKTNIRLINHAHVSTWSSVRV